MSESKLFFDYLESGDFDNPEYKGKYSFMQYIIMGIIWKLINSKLNNLSAIYLLHEAQARFFNRNNDPISKREPAFIFECFDSSYEYQSSLIELNNQYLFLLKNDHEKLKAEIENFPYKNKAIVKE